MRTLIFCLVLAACHAQAGGRYLTWVDDEGRVHNTFVDTRYSELRAQTQRRIRLDARSEQPDDGATRWPGSQLSGERKRRYFTWVDANGKLQNSFYAGTQQPDGTDAYLLPDGSRGSDYIDADVLEGRGFVRSEYGSPYYTWVDEQGRMHNSSVPTGERKQATSTSQAIRYSEGREVTFERRAPLLPGLDGQPNDAMRSLLAGSEERVHGLYQSLLDRCCGQLAEDDFTELSADQPRYEELNRYSPSFDFPMGRSYYAALKLPRSGHTYGLRVRSFANKQLVYPSLLFLDEAKQPTRLVSDAVYQLHGETWYRYAFIEGTVPVKAGQGERYVLLLTTDEDRSLQTLDNQPFKRPLQDLEVNEVGMQAHAHADEGGFELAIVR
jgi:hypothetical protein